MKLANLAKKKTLLIIAGIISCVILVSEFTSSKTSHSFFQLKATPAGSILHQFQEWYETEGIDREANLFPSALSDEEAREWFNRLEAHRHKEEQNERPQLPSTFLPLSNSIHVLEDKGVFYPLEHSFSIPYADFLHQLNPDEQGINHTGRKPVHFHTSGFWTVDFGTQQALFLQGKIETTYEEELLALIENQQNIRHYGFNPLHVRSTYPTIYGETTRGYGFQNIYLAHEDQITHFLLEAFYIPVNSDFRPMLTTDAHFSISFRSDHDGNESEPVAIAVEQALGEEYLIRGNTLVLSPTHRLRFERAIQYDSFTIFLGSLSQNIEHEALTHASFIWKDGEQKSYRARSISLPWQDQIIFVSEGNPALDQMEQLVIEDFQANFYYDYRLTVPLKELKKEQLLSFLGWTISVRDIIQNAEEGPPELLVYVEKEDPQPFQGDFDIQYKLDQFITIMGRSKENEAVTFTDQFFSWRDEYINEELHLTFEDGWYSNPDQEWYGGLPPNFTFSAYEYELTLPVFTAEISSREKPISFSLQKTGRYYEPR